VTKLKPSKDFVDPTRGRIFSVRFIVSLVLMVVGIAWIAYYYIAVRPGDDGKAGSPAFMADWADWNYLIGFGLFFLGLFVAAHPSTPLGRGRGVVVGMLGCFLLGLAWIVTYYFVAQSTTAHVPVMDKLEQMNLIVGVAFMAVGFTFATKWE
jgi:hypothetical protein